MKKHDFDKKNVELFCNKVSDDMKNDVFSDNDSYFFEVSIIFVVCDIKIICKEI